MLPIKIRILGPIIEICFEAKNVNSLVEAIDKFIKLDQKKIRKLSLNGLKHLKHNFDQELILGDINGDEILNVLDVILLVNMALGSIESDLIGDLNGDGGINILDVILLVNLILN